LAAVEAKWHGKPLLVCGFTGSYKKYVIGDEKAGTIIDIKTEYAHHIVCLPHGERVVSGLLKLGICSAEKLEEYSTTHTKLFLLHRRGAFPRQHHSLESLFL
jgi:hypothetical protein